jgi:hypothetical protein
VCGVRSIKLCWLEHHLIPRLASSGLVQLNVVCHCLTKFPTVLTVLLTRGTLKIRPCKIARISLCLEKPRASLLLGWPVPLSLSLYLSQRGRTQRCPRALSASRRRPQKSTTTKTNLSSPHQPHFAHSRLPSKASTTSKAALHPYPIALDEFFHCPTSDTRLSLRPASNNCTVSARSRRLGYRLAVDIINSRAGVLAAGKRT